MPTIHTLLRVGLSALLVALSLRPDVAFAQASTTAPKLKINILDGQGAVNNVKQRMAREPVVQVTDENDRPVGGALVTFALPQQGPSGIFSNGARSLTVTTDANGQAATGPITANSSKGDFEIQVSASHEGQTATTTLNQTNIGAGLSAATLGIIIGAVAAGAAIAIIASTGGGNDSQTNRTTTITPGGGTVTSPLTIAPGMAGRSGAPGFQLSW
ncbi:MAG: hypothetical protein GC160_11545 [Acidobacteria bacterium]|nr:hypothetical protein [Acidobacteriota bacterium]